MPLAFLEMKIKDNIITDSDQSGVLVDGANNAIQDHTINEATIGL
jgi:hypothetical protein